MSELVGVGIYLAIMIFVGGIGFAKWLNMPPSRVKDMSDRELQNHITRMEREMHLERLHITRKNPNARERQ